MATSRPNWRQEAAFDSAAACEEYRKREADRWGTKSVRAIVEVDRADSPNERTKAQETARGYTILFAVYKAAKCVPTTDRRLR